MKEAWRDKLEEFRTDTDDPKALKGSIVWLGRSNGSPASEFADDIAELLTHAGATVATSSPGPRGLLCGPDVTRVDEADAVIMLGHTPGVVAEAIDFCKPGPWQKPILPRMQVVLPDEHRAGYMYSRLNELGARTHLYADDDVDDGNLALASLYRAFSICRTTKLQEKEEATAHPTIGIVTALPLERDAVRRAIPGGRRARMNDDGPGYRMYTHLVVPAYGAGEHQVVLVNAGMSNNKAVAAAKQLLNDYASVRNVIMVGIAGGVPNLSDAKQDVHLGDVVVSNAKGVIKYDMKKRTSEGDIPNHELRPPSHDWLALAEELSSDDEALEAAWKDLDEKCAAGNVVRPEKDELLDEPDLKKRKPATRADDPTRVPDKPRVFMGPIGCGDTVVKSAAMRDEIAGRFGIKAFEMEGSGIAEAMWQGTRGYLVVRGICDYCNDAKNKEWQPYAAAAAATFARHLIASMPITVGGD